jgi:hypothetical protein
VSALLDPRAPQQAKAHAVTWAAAQQAAPGAPPAAGAVLPGLPVEVQLWGATPLWAQPAAHGATLIGPQLGPLVARAVVHPWLPLIALQQEPSLAVQTTPALLHAPLASASTEEAALAR